MKKTSRIFAAALFVAGCALASAAAAQPAIQVAVALDKTVALVRTPLLATVTVTNEGAAVITTRGFMDRPFNLDLVFTAPGGGEVRTHVAKEAQTPPPPPVFYDAGVPLQVEPVETVAGGWTVAVGPFNVLDFYTLAVAGSWTVRAEFSLRTYPQITHTIEGSPYAEIGTSDWQGTIVSTPTPFLLGTDNDGDGRLYPTEDCDDADPAIPGPVEIPGNGKDDDCNPATPDRPAVLPGTLKVQADLHTVGTGSHPGSSKAPLAGLPVRVFAKGAGSCANTFGTSWQNYKSIWLNCTVPNDQIGATGAGGAATFTLPPGDYLVIGEQPGAAGAEPTYLGVSVGEVASGALVQKYLQLIVKADNKKVPGKTTIRTGSLLLIIEPEYVEWDGTQELYPFIFESVGEWGVVTSVVPPEGFEADNRELSAVVSDEQEALQFTITDVGSEWVSTGVTHKIKHKGKSETVRSEIGVKLSNKLSQKKGVGRFGKNSR